MNVSEIIIITCATLLTAILGLGTWAIKLFKGWVEKDRKIIELRAEQDRQAVETLRKKIETILEGLAREMISVVKDNNAITNKILSTLDDMNKSLGDIKTRPCQLEDYEVVEQKKRGKK